MSARHLRAGLALPLGLLLGGQAIAVEAARDLRVVLNEINTGFVCPQFLPDEAARMASMQSFGAALATVGPRRVTAPEAQRIYRRMIELHNCAAAGNAVALPAAAQIDGPAPPG